MAITSSDVHIDVALSNISIGYQNEEYIADQIFPQILLTMRKYIEMI